MRLSADLPVMKVMVKNGAEFERLILSGSSMRQIQIFVNDEDFKTLTTFAKRHCENYWGTFNHKLGRASWCYECQHHTQGLAVHCAGGQKYITIVAWRPYGAEWSRVGAPDRKWVK